MEKANGKRWRGKRILSLILSVVSAVGLSACIKNSGDTSPPRSIDEKEEDNNVDVKKKEENSSYRGFFFNNDRGGAYYFGEEENKEAEYLQLNLPNNEIIVNNTYPFGVLEEENFRADAKYRYFRAGEFLEYSEYSAYKGSDLFAVELSTGEVTKIKDNVEGFAALEDNQVLYTTDEGGLYLYEDGEEFEILREGNIIKNIAVNEDHTEAVYMVYWESGEEFMHDLYHVYLENPETSDLLTDKIMDFIGNSPSLDRIYYIGGDSKVVNELYVIEDFKEPKKLDRAKDIFSLRLDEKGNLYYVKHEKPVAELFVTDDMELEYPNSEQDFSDELEYVHGGKKLTAESNIGEFAIMTFLDEYNSSMQLNISYAFYDYGNLMYYGGDELKELSPLAAIIDRKELEDGENNTFFVQELNPRKERPNLSDLYENEYLKYMYAQVKPELNPETVDFEEFLYSYYEGKNSPISAYLYPNMTEDVFWEYSYASDISAEAITGKLLAKYLEDAAYGVYEDGEKKREISSKGAITDAIMDSHGRLSYLEQEIKSDLENIPYNTDLYNFYLEDDAALYTVEKDEKPRKVDEGNIILTKYAADELYYYKDWNDTENTGKLFCEGEEIQDDIFYVYKKGEQAFIIGGSKKGDGSALYYPDGGGAELIADNVSSLIPLGGSAFAYLGDMYEYGDSLNLYIYKEGKKEKILENVKSIPGATGF